MTRLDQTPSLDAKRALALAREHYGLDGRLTPLPGERDQNFRLDAGEERYVLKIANAAEDPAFVEAQQAVLSRLAEAGVPCPVPVRTLQGADSVRVGGEDDREHLVRLVGWLDGDPLATREAATPALIERLGTLLGRVARALDGFDHPALHRDLDWDLARGRDVVERYRPLIGDVELRGQVDSLIARFDRHAAGRLAELPRSVIHNDANDHNVLVDGARVVGLIDFGDMVHSYSVGELAIGAAYALLGSDEPLDALEAIVAGYHAERPLATLEQQALYGLLCLRLCTSVVMAAHQSRQRPDDPYLSISQQPIRRALPRLLERPFAWVEQVVRDACTSPRRAAARAAEVALLAARRRHVGANVRLGYRAPVELSRGWMQYLFASNGRRYLDAYNNVPHVGHCHPRVVEAATRQLRRLNTNTRYLCDAPLAYAAELAATLPDGLELCYFVNSASEANELALRLARAATGGRDMIVLGAAYHGHTTSLIDISPYKHDGPGGHGPPAWVQVAALPDRYRDGDRPLDGYLSAVEQCARRIDERGGRLAGFIAESCPSVGGQLFLPDGYLDQVYRVVRRAGGLCIADEVQTGFGRLGSCFYAFEEHGVTPDIVVLGKPIGNGYPLAAVVTTRAIADSFDDGMEFFSTFGGNNVACEVGRAVLAVLRDEGLQAHAATVGRELFDACRQLAERHEAIGDVRGRGLFGGIELVEDRASRRPAAALASSVVEQLREHGVLIGTDGPLHNVLKIRPPMPFGSEDVELLVTALDRALARDSGLIVDPSDLRG